MALALYFATILSFKVRFKNMWKGILFFPYLINGVAIGLIFLNFLKPGGGLDTVLMKTGLESLVHQWTGDPDIANYSLAAVSVWRYTGLTFVMFLGAIQSINSEIYEAAALDGANRWHEFWSIILPSIRPIVGLAFILGISGSLSVFEIPPFVMTNAPTGRRRSSSGPSGWPSSATPSGSRPPWPSCCWSSSCWSPGSSAGSSPPRRRWISREGRRGHRQVHDPRRRLDRHAAAARLILFGSFKTNQEFLSTNPFQPPADWFNVDNYVLAFTKGGMALAFFNTALIFVAAIAGTILIGGAATAYALDRFRFKGRTIVLLLFLLATLVPGVTTQVATFQIINGLGLYGSRWALILLFMGTDIVSIYIFLQFMRSIPRSLDEAAMIEGAGHLRIFFQIILPNLRPAIATVVIIKASASTTSSSCRTSTSTTRTSCRSPRRCSRSRDRTARSGKPSARAS